MEEEIGVTTVSEYIKALNKKFKNLKTCDELFCLWFRGESNADIKTPIVPKAYRDFGGPLDDDNHNEHVYNQARAIENNLVTTFSRESFRFLVSNGINTESWNQYILMQHYGLKTRLLDWTESALTALFFAVSDANNNGKVWILSPLRLNEYTIEKISGKRLPAMCIPNDLKEKNKLINTQTDQFNINELCRRYLYLDFESYQNEVLGNTYYPLAIYPNILDERMAIQQSCFTIFGNKVNGLLSGDYKNNYLENIVIDAKSKRSIKEELKWLGVSYKTIYPDLGGICKSIEDHNNIDNIIFKRVK